MNPLLITSPWRFLWTIEVLLRSLWHQQCLFQIAASFRPCVIDQPSSGHHTSLHSAERRFFKAHTFYINCVHRVHISARFLNAYGYRQHCMLNHVSSSKTSETKALGKDFLERKTRRWKQNAQIVSWIKLICRHVIWDLTIYVLKARTESLF